MCIFPDAQRQLNPQSRVRSGQISNSSNVMVVLVTCMNEEHPFKSESSRVVKTLLIDCNRHVGLRDIHV